MSGSSASANACVVLSLKVMIKDFSSAFMQSVQMKDKSARNSLFILMGLRFKIVA
jgi:hypothetical protein